MGPCYPRRPGRAVIGDLDVEVPSTLRWPRSTLAHPLDPLDPRSRHARVARPAPKATYPYLNRELSWLEFNARVLHEARDERNPLLERVKFLAIFAGNLDEFFQVRVAGLRQQVEAGKVARSPDGRTADEQLAAARERVLELVADHSAIYVSVRARARRRGHRAARLRGDPRAPRGAPPALPRRDLPGPDAARGRSGPSVPVHLDAQPVDRGRAARSGDRRARLRAGQGPADPAAPARGRAVALRAASTRSSRPTSTRSSPGWRSRSTTSSGSPATPTSRSRRTRPTTCCWPSRRSSAGAASGRRSGSRSSGRCRPRRSALLLRGLGLGESGLLRGQRHARPDRAVRDRRARPPGPQARARGRR